MSRIASDTQWLDATAQAELVATGDVSARELVDAAIERIEALDGPLNGVVMRWFDHARTLADEAPTGPFGGVPFLLKDLWSHYEGQVLTNGSVALRDAQPVSTHTTNLVRRFHEAGLMSLGRSSSPELGSVPVTEPAAPPRKVRRENPFMVGWYPGSSEEPAPPLDFRDPS